MTLKTQVPLYLMVAGIGIIIGLLLRNPASSIDTTQQENTTPDNIADAVIADTELDSFKNEIINLKQLIIEESIFRKEIQTNLETLQNKVVQHSLQINGLSSDVDGSSEPEENGKQIYKTSSRLPLQQPKEWFNYDALIVAGVETSEANRLRNLYDDIELQKLYLRDRAIREKWINDDKYQNELGALEDKFRSLRNGLDDTTYDAFLFASGHSNRVVVQSVLSTSPAGEAGIQAGDHIIRYGNSKIYTWSDLRKATTSGQANELVEVIINRGGNNMSLYIPQGPLGIRLENKSVKP